MSATYWRNFDMKDYPLILNDINFISGIALEVSIRFEINSSVIFKQGKPRAFSSQ